MPDPRENQFLEVLNHFPGDATTLFGLASYYRDSGRHDEAIQRFRECIEAAPHYGAAYLNLGELLKAKGDLEEARRVLKTAVERAESKGDVEIVNIAGERLSELDES